MKLILMITVVLVCWACENTVESSIDRTSSPENVSSAENASSALTLQSLIKEDSLEKANILDMPYVPKDLSPSIWWSFILNPKGGAFLNSIESPQDSNYYEGITDYLDKKKKLHNQFGFFINNKNYSEHNFSSVPDFFLSSDSLVAQIVENDTIVFREVFSGIKLEDISIDLALDSSYQSEDSIKVDANLKISGMENIPMRYLFHVEPHHDEGTAGGSGVRDTLATNSISIIAPKNTESVTASLSLTIYSVNRQNVEFKIKWSKEALLVLKCRRWC